MGLVLRPSTIVSPRNHVANFGNNPPSTVVARRGANMAFKSVFDPAFKYRTAVSTDIRQTFERIRREQQLAQQQPQHQERRLKVVPIQHEERRRKVIPTSAGVQLHRLK
jgi:hypothetical protein